MKALRIKDDQVSTHSRLKAADVHIPDLKQQLRFNTQPPEGGWPFQHI